MSEPFAMTKVGLSMKIPTVTALRPDLCFLVLNYREIFVQYDTNIGFAQRTLIPIQARGGDRFVREALRKLIIPLPGRPNHLSLEALTQDDVSLSADSPWIRGSSDSIQSIIMVDHSRVRNLIIGPELEPDITFAFMPIFPFGNGRWILNSVHPHSLRVDTGMLVSRPEISSHPDAVILVFRNLEYPPEYLGIFLAASARVRVKLCCRNLENVRSDEIIKDRFEGELSRYLKNNINRDDNIQWLDYDEREEGSNKELTVNYGLSSRRHQVVAEDENGNCNVRFSLSLQYVRNGQLVAPIEITFYGLSDD